jgi:hypothetical protein
MKSLSSTAGISTSRSALGENWVLLLLGLINSLEGVAGSLLLRGLLLCAGMFGDLPAERGREGGGMRISVSGSGLTESGPEPSLLPGGPFLHGPGFPPKSWLLATLEMLVELEFIEFGFRRF